MPVLTETEFKATMMEPMIDVTATPGEVIDIWPYVAAVSSEIGLSAFVLERSLVDRVYRSGNGVHDHVLLPMGVKNKFVVIVVDRLKHVVTGHHLLDFNREYGLS